jgi:hypothetical protein
MVGSELMADFVNTAGAEYPSVQVVGVRGDLDLRAGRREGCAR